MPSKIYSWRIFQSQVKTCPLHGRPTLTIVRLLVHTGFTGIWGKISPWLLFCSRSFLNINPLQCLYYLVFIMLTCTNGTEVPGPVLPVVPLAAQQPWFPKGIWLLLLLLSPFTFFFFDLDKDKRFCHEVVRVALCWLWFTWGPTEACGWRSPSYSLQSVSQNRAAKQKHFIFKNTYCKAA